METIESPLEKIGLTKNEILVYMAILRGCDTPSQIDQKTPLHRPAVYKSLDSLCKRGLVNTQRMGKRNIYRLNDPAILKAEADDMINGLEKAISEISAKLAANKQQLTIPRFIQGRFAITSVFSDILKTLKRGETFYRITSEKNLDYINSRLPRNYRKHRDDKNLQRLVISNESSGKKKRSRLERFIKFFPKEIDPLEQNIITLIYSHKTAFIDASNDTAVIIENAALSDFLSKIFLALYKRL